MFPERSAVHSHAARPPGAAIRPTGPPGAMSGSFRDTRDGDGVGEAADEHWNRSRLACRAVVAELATVVGAPTTHGAILVDLVMSENSILLNLMMKSTTEFCGDGPSLAGGKPWLHRRKSPPKRWP